MKKYNALYLIAFVLSNMLFCSCKQNNKDIAVILANGRWIDLSWSFEESTVYWPTNVPFKHDTVFYGINDKGYFYSSFKYSAEEHGGTHFDAPIHFAQGGRTIDQITVAELTGAAIVVDVSAQCVYNRDYLANVDDCKKWEEMHGKIPDQAIVLLHTGYGKHWNDHEKYSGTLKSGTEGVAELHFPGLSPEAAEWLVKERNIKAFGLDTPSIDNGQSKEFDTHRFLCGHNITAYENIANLDQLPPTGAYLVAAPMKIKGGSGAPLRLLAWIPE